jgi:hypothetical protein
MFRPVMRNRVLLAFLPAGLVALAWACGGHTNASSPGSDGGADADAGDDADDASGLDDFGTLPDGSSNNCTYKDVATGELLDPVALCLQQQALTYEAQYAYTKGHGVAPGWSSTAPYAQVQGHDWQDDLGLAGAIGAYYCSSEVYGNNHSTPTFSAVLGDLAPVLVGELQQTPSPLQGSYDGELYFRLRWAQAAFDYANNTQAQELKGIADTFGASIAGHAYAVAAAGGDAGTAGGMVIGTQNGDGTVSYAPAQTMMAAAALLDMAVLGSSSADAGPVQAWATTAQQVISYVMARGRDPVTGLFYQSLVTSSDPGHDAVGPGTPTNDTMLTQTQAWVVLALARAQDLLDTYPSNPSADAGADAGEPDASSLFETYWVAGAGVATAMTNAGLFDGNTNPPPAPAVPPVGAYMEGLILSGSQLLTNKVTLDNAIMLGGSHRVQVGAGSPLAYQLGELRSALGGVPVGTLQLASTSLFTIVTDANEDLLQQSYLRAGSKAFGDAVAYTPGAEGGPEGTALEPGATSYRSDAVHAMIEGISQLWHGAPNDARCAP